MNRTILFAALLLTAAAASANPTTERNGVLASKDGRTLYTFDKDSAGKSHCTGGCLAAWPAFTVANPKAAGGDFSIVVRDDGVQQWAYRNQPLYFYAGDAQPGDVNGDRQGGVWHVIRPAGKTIGRVADQNDSGGYGYRY